MNYYSILGVDRRAPVAMIRKAYHRLALIHHPDKGGVEEDFRCLKEAYDALMDQNLRYQHDRQVDREEEQQRQRQKQEDQRQREQARREQELRATLRKRQEQVQWEALRVEKERLRREEALRDQARREDERRKYEEAVRQQVRREEERRQREEFLRQQARLAEEQRQREEAQRQQARLAEEQRQREEALRVQEQVRLAEEQRQREDALLEHARKEEHRKLGEQRRLEHETGMMIQSHFLQQRQQVQADYTFAKELQCNDMQVDNDEGGLAKIKNRRKWKRSAKWEKKRTGMETPVPSSEEQNRVQRKRKNQDQPAPRPPPVQRSRQVSWQEKRQEHQDQMSRQRTQSRQQQVAALDLNSATHKRRHPLGPTSHGGVPPSQYQHHHVPSQPSLAARMGPSGWIHHTQTQAYGQGLHQSGQYFGRGTQNVNGSPSGHQHQGQQPQQYHGFSPFGGFSQLHTSR